MSELNVPRARLPFLIAVLVAMMAGIVVVGIAFHRVAGPQSAAGIPAPLPVPPLTPTPTATPAPTAATVAFADCTQTTFGPALAPLNPPSSVHAYTAVPPPTIDASKLYLLTIKTARGTIDVCLQPTLAPNTVNVIVTLARNHFYDGLTFHRVVAGFVIQGGDPTGTGNGGPGFSFNDEPVLNQYVLGAIAMANSGPNTNGSQFFIDIADNSSKLQPKYNLFGKVRNGLDVALRIQQGDLMTTVTVAQQQ
ncbi:MAG TPA: peptidylprolyl isomerase [Candidatus Dormibacteraeota bacterium]